MTEHLPSLLAKEFSISTSEARRGLAQGAVLINGEVVHDLDVTLSTGAQIQLGKRRSAIYEPVRKEPGYVHYPAIEAVATVAGRSLEELDAKLVGQTVVEGPLSRVLAGERQYYAYLAARRTSRWQSLLHRFRLFQKTP